MYDIYVLWREGEEHVHQAVNSLHISTQITGNNVVLKIEDQVKSV